MTRWPTLNLRPEGRHSDPNAPSGNGEAPRLRPREAAPAGSSDVQRVVRRFARPVPLVGVALVLVALVGYWSVYSATTHRTLVLVMTRALPAGAVLKEGDLRTAELAGDRRVIDRVIAERQLATVVGRRLASPVAVGVPLPRAALAAPARRTAAFTIAVPAVRAVGAAVKPGDRVTVLATFGAGGGGATTRVVARGLRVLAVDAQSTTTRQDAILPVTVALPDPATASELALANDDAKVSLLLDGDDNATEPIPPASDEAKP